MPRHSWLLVAGLAIASAAFAQQSTQQQAVQPPAQAPVASGEGFFRPADDPVINAAPYPGAQGEGSATRSDVAALAAEAAAAQAEVRALERELDRVQREHERARAAAAQRPAPMIVSPLDGTAPIVSPIDR